jgi:hemoglobin-like flavoprotein
MTALFQFLDSLIDKTMRDNQEQLHREAVQKIHPELNTYFNSINVLVGRQGSGKTFSVVKEASKISYADPYAHMFVYITKDGSESDATFGALRHLINIPVVFTKQEEAEGWIDNLLAYKDLYNEIKAKHAENRLPPDQVNDIKRILMIHDFTKPFLHTIIFFEDTSNSPLFKKATMFFPQLIAKCRHVGCSFFFAVQFWRSLPTELKANITTLYIFPSYSKQQLHYILSQIPVGETFERIYHEYQRLAQHQKLVVDTINGDIQIA